MSNYLNKESKIPLYMQLANILVDQIVHAPDNTEGPLLSEREMKEIYGVSRATVRQALDYIDRQGYIKRQHGSGTYISSKAVPQNLRYLYSFTEEVKKLGKTPRTQTLYLKSIEPSETVKSIMQVDEPVYEFVRCMYADERPEMYEKTYVPCSKCPGFTIEMLRKRPFYKILRETYGIVLTSAVQEFQVVGIEKEAALHLMVEERSPGMMVERKAYCGEEIIQYSISTLLPGMVKYRVELK